jgi:hypothetical protein
MKEKTEAFEDKADKKHHFLSEVYAATISIYTNYKIQVLNTSSIETVKTLAVVKGHDKIYEFDA